MSEQEDGMTEPAEYAYDVPITARIYARSHEEAIEKMHRLATDARHLQYVQGLNVSVRAPDYRGPVVAPDAS